MITTNRQPRKLATGLQVRLVLFTQSGFVHVVYSCKHKNYIRQSCAGSKILTSQLILQSIEKRIIANSRKWQVDLKLMALAVILWTLRKERGHKETLICLYIIELAWLLSPSSLTHKKREDRTDRKHLGNWKTVRYSVILERTIKFVFFCKIRERRVNLYPCAKELLEFIMPSDVDI